MIGYHDIIKVSRTIDLVGDCAVDVSYDDHAVSFKLGGIVASCRRLNESFPSKSARNIIDGAIKDSNCQFTIGDTSLWIRPIKTAMSFSEKSIDLSVSKDDNGLSYVEMSSCDIEGGNSSFSDKLFVFEESDADGLKVYFDPKYLMECLSVIDDSCVVSFIKDQESATTEKSVLFTAGGHENYILMPLRP
jgi:DNA polymerase III sliding clamp (beta) subunit (PCNA family)